MIDEAVIFDMIGSGNVKKPIRDGGHEAKRALLLVMAGALLLGAAFLTATLLLTACSASVSSAIRADGGARISIQAEVPAVLASKFRKLASSGSGSSAAGPLFDIEAIRKSIAGRPSLSLIEISSPTPDSVSAVLSARSLDELAASPDIKGSGLLTISKGSGWTECRFRLNEVRRRLSLPFPASTLIWWRPFLLPRSRKTRSRSLNIKPCSRASWGERPCRLWNRPPSA